MPTYDYSNNTASITAYSDAGFGDNPVISFDDMVYLVKLAKKDKKLSEILRRLVDGAELELPF